YNIFPFDGSQYLYSPIHHDFYDIPVQLEDIWMGSPTYRDPGKEMHQMSDTIIRAYLHDNIDALQKKIQLLNTADINDVKGATGEVLVYGTKYVGVFVDHLNEPYLSFK